MKKLDCEFNLSVSTFTRRFHYFARLLGIVDSREKICNSQCELNGNGIAYLLVDVTLVVTMENP